MPEIYLDDAPLDIDDKENDSTVGDLIDGVEKELKPMRRFVNEISLDGDKLANWRTGQTPGIRLASLHEIRLTTASVDEMMLRGVATVQEFLAHIADNIARTVKNIRSGTGDVLTAVSGVINDLNEVVKTIDSLVKGTASYPAELFRENPANYYKGVLDHMKALRDAHAEGDTVLIADILEYELKPYIEDMCNKIFHSDRS